MKTRVTLTTALAASLVVACGDDSPAKPDASVGIDSPKQPDAAEPDAPPDGPPAFTAPSPTPMIRSAAGHDQLLAAVSGPGDSFYVAGWAATDTTSNTTRNIIVGKLSSTGVPDTTFGTDGFLNTQIAYRGQVSEIDMVANADGSIWLAATVAAATVNPVDASDTDIALMKITAAGALDTTFGGGDGVVTHSFNTSILSGGMMSAPVGRDAVRNIAVRNNGEIFVTGLQRGEGVQMGTANPRTDTDFVVAKLTPAGALDTSFDGDGKHLLDIYLNNAHSSAVAHAISVNDDGSVIAGGYANAGLSFGPQPVVYRLTPAGALDTNFASSGVFHDVVLEVQTEIYNWVRHGDTLVTAGYGRRTGTPTGINDWVSLRFDTITGMRDTVWGNGATGTPPGVAFFDPTPADNMAGANCRNAVPLPEGKTLLIGSSSRMANTNNTPEVQDAVFAVLTDAGALDTEYGTGIVTYALGDDGVDQFWGGAVNGNTVLIVGWRGARNAMAPSATDNDDSYIVLLPIQ